MADFKYFTRGNSSPQGKPRVYFTAHPDDYDRCFEEIRTELLERQNCAVFYLDADTKPEEVADYELRLGEMQLFVIPVTTKLLTQPNRAMDVEVPFAFERHIPVLPLMQESGLDELFSRKDKFGDLQYLDKNNIDPTAIPYEEKLTNYLESVIVGDELAQQVRDAFDAYIFLSYRKKDRKYAQELMRLIHANPFCRDIAIWYDEFLTPGEDFNDAIKAALEKSGLFALTVTPNLVNENNYIVEHEYPMAKELKMDILPAEMVPTDRDKLSEMYREIPEPVGADNGEALKERLLPLVKKLAITENDNDPKHNFFIGLAYLTGIDVEVDQKRAVALITGSAEAGYIPATEKLVSMYENGEGVERDYHIAVEWREKLVKQRKKEYKANPIEEAAFEVLNSLWSLGNAYWALKQFIPAKRVCEEMLRYSEMFVEKFPNKDFMRGLSISYNSLGDIAKMLGKLDEAESFYRKALEVSKALTKEIATVEGRSELSVCYNNLGKVTKMQGKLDEAEEFYSKSLEIRIAIAEETGSAIDRRSVMTILADLGDIAYESGRIGEAESYYHQAFEISIVLAEETKSTLARSDLSISYSNLGNVAKAKNNLSEAESLFRKALEIREMLVKETDTVTVRRNLSVVYCDLGEIAEIQKNFSKAENYYRKAIAIDKAIAEETDTIESRNDLAIDYDNLGNVIKAQKRFDDAEYYYLKSLEIKQEIMEEIGTVESRYGLSISYSNLGILAEAQGKITEAEEFYRKALEIRVVLVKETGSIRSYDNLACSCFNLGRLLKDLSMLERSLSIWMMLGEKCPEVLRYRKNQEVVQNMIRECFE